MGLLASSLWRFHPLLRFVILRACERVVALKLRIEEADVTAGIDAERFQRLVVMRASEKIVARAGDRLLALREIEWEDEIRNGDAVDLVCLRLHGVAHLQPVKNLTVFVWMFAHDEQVRLRVADQLERFMRERDRPRLSHLTTQ